MHLSSRLKASILKFLPLPLAKNIASKVDNTTTLELNKNKKNIFIDVSVLAEHDAKTGIQRVVKEVLSHLINEHHHSINIVPVAATKRTKYHEVSLKINGSTLTVDENNTNITPQKGDVFLGLDLAAHILPKHWDQLLEWKNSGVSIQIVVYDLLPALNPEWFKKRSVKNFNQWLRTIVVFADKFHCISNTVSKDLDTWIKKSYDIQISNNSLYVFPLGSNFKVLANNTSIPLLNHNALEFCKQYPTILMVGTIEPRKGHEEIINAFIELWRQSESTYQLIVVGSSGWKTESVQKLLIDTSKIYNKLLWLDSADDNLLEQLYISSTGVIAASKGEGFGLPIVEAAFFNKPLLVRDIPIFREVAQGNVTFFKSRPQKELSAKDLTDWFSSISKNNNRTNEVEITTWASSTSKLLGNIINVSKNLLDY